MQYDMQDEVLLRLPTGWFTGVTLVTLWTSKVFQMMALRAARLRIEREKTYLTRAAGGYNCRNVTTICMFYELLSMLKRNKGPRLSRVMKHFFVVPHAGQHFRQCAGNEIAGSLTNANMKSVILLGCRNAKVLKENCAKCISRIDQNLNPMLEFLEYSRTLERSTQSVHQKNLQIYLLPFRLRAGVTIRMTERREISGGGNPTCLGFYVRGRQEVEAVRAILILMGEKRSVPHVNGNPTAQACPAEIVKEQNTLKAATCKPTVEIYLSELEKWHHDCEVSLFRREAWLSLHGVFETLEIHKGLTTRDVEVTTSIFGHPAQKVFRSLMVHQGTLPRSQGIQFPV